MDRGLAGVLAALVRLASSELNRNAAAQDLSLGHPLMTKAMKTIEDRVELVEGKNASVDRAKQMLKERNDLWLSRIQKSTANRLGYRDMKDGVTVGLLRPAGEASWDRWTCLNSLRDVEPAVNLILTDDFGMDEPPPATPEQDE